MYMHAIGGRQGRRAVGVSSLPESSSGVDNFRWNSGSAPSEPAHRQIPVERMPSLGDADQGPREGVVARGPQPRYDFPPAPATEPCDVDRYECRAHAHLPTISEAIS